MKKMKKAALTLIMAAAICGLTACGGSAKETEREESMETENRETAENEAIVITEDETTMPEDTAVPESDEEPAEETVAVTVPEEFTPVAGLSEKYADLENRSFAYKGQIFTLGESTFQDLIDGGIPFDENALNNVSNNVNSNYETERYSVDINEYVGMQFTFINTTQSNIPEAECLLSHVRWYLLFVPQPDYDDSMNEKITSLINDAANYVCFSFPLTLTKEQLLENNGDATEIDEYNNVEYRVDSEVYMGDSGYSFKFDKNTNQLKDLTISWLP